MKRIVMLAVLGLAAPAYADQKPVALDDTQLEKVAAGGDSLAPVTNVNISPIILIQNAVAVTTQTANTGWNGSGGNDGQGWKKNGNNGQGNGCKKKSGGQNTGTPTSTGAVAQWASTTAFNVATINYTVAQR